MDAVKWEFVYALFSGTGLILKKPICCGRRNWAKNRDCLPYVASSPKPPKILENLKQAGDIVFS